MLFSDRRATGGGRAVRVVVLACAVIMFVAAVSTIEEGTGGFTIPRHRAIARTVILLAGGTAVMTAVVAWWRTSRRH